MKNKANIKRCYTIDEVYLNNNIGNQTFNEQKGNHKNINKDNNSNYTNKFKRMYTNEIHTITIDKIVMQLDNNKDYSSNISKCSQLRSRSQNKSNLWRKTYNILKMTNAFLHPSLERIDNDNIIFDDSMKYSILGINKDKSKNKSISKSNTTFNKISLSYEQFMRKNNVEREFIRVQLKERVYNLIEEGPKDNNTLIQALDILFEQNPEKFIYPCDHINYLFNQPLPNGKTLLYIACQEGCFDVVNYFLK